MLQPKGFLEEELKNVTLSLKEALRHEYGTLRSNDFYEECLFRLEIVKSELSRTSERNFNNLSALAMQLSSLSELVARIERSHLGEFSWSFANALEKIAIRTCHSDISGNIFGPPLFFISADGGLGAYRIHPEQEETDIVGRRIFNIVFPRSLKYHVLLHSILGHELGHAAWTIPDLQKKFLSDVIVPLFASSSLATTSEFKTWLINHCGARNDIEDDLIQRILDSWQEEFFCDLFGLILMGPSFIAAHRSLLSSLDPLGLKPGQEHPPNITRYWLLDVASKYLKFDVPSAGSGQILQAAFSEFWTSMTSPSPYPNWVKVFTVNAIENAVSTLVNILDRSERITYRQGAIGVLEEIYGQLCSAVPPIQKTINQSAEVQLKRLDFRDILYVGWLAWHTPEVERSSLPFMDINRLCDRAILQQEAIDRKLNSEEAKG